MIHTSISRNCVVFLLSRRLTWSAINGSQIFDQYAFYNKRLQNAVVVCVSLFHPLFSNQIQPVLTMVKSDTEQAVFVGTDSRVYKIPFVHCCDYILRNLSDAGDPYCKSIVTGDW